MYSKAESPFLNKVKEYIRLKHLSLSTERSYLHYIHDYIVFCDKKHPSELGRDEVRAYLTHLALEQDVSASTQNVALAALLFLYQGVLGIDLGHIEDVVRAKRPKRLPVVLTRSEIKRLFQALEVQCVMWQALAATEVSKNAVGGSSKRTKHGLISILCLSGSYCKF